MAYKIEFGGKVHAPRFMRSPKGLFVKNGNLRAVFPLPYGLIFNNLKCSTRTFSTSWAKTPSSGVS
jgi:hypothetical protein